MRGSVARSRRPVKNTTKQQTQTYFKSICLSQSQCWHGQSALHERGTQVLSAKVTTRLRPQPPGCGAAAKALLLSCSVDPSGEGNGFFKEQWKTYNLCPYIFKFSNNYSQFLTLIKLWKENVKWGENFNCTYQESREKSKVKWVFIHRR